MASARVVHFEYMTKDPDTLQKFFEDTFGWTTEKWGGPFDYRLVTAGNEDGGDGIGGGIMPAGQAPFDAPVCNTFGVGDIDAMMKKVEANGGKMLTPKSAIPGMGWFCYAQTPDGMPFGMMEPDDNAK
ncbi:MAG: VOC family protein [Candidatus Eremiobacteraeota bacterium]|nr:VOC family protein [Candidatus Eremiobacteraeota bacterium]